MATEIAALLLRQHEIAWKLTTCHLDGLSLAECLWRPSTKGLHVSIADNGSWRGEWPEHEGYDLGPPSMAWLLWHMVFWWSMVVDHSFGEAALDRDSIDCPSDPDRVGALLRALHDEWTGHVSRLSEDELRSSQRTRWPFTDRPFGDVVGWVNVELTKNAAELGYGGEPLNNSVRSAFQSEKPQIVWCDPSDSSHSYGRGSQRARCGFSGETLRDGPLRGLQLVWARLFGTTKPRSPKPGRSLPQRRRRARAELFRGSLDSCTRRGRRAERSAAPRTKKARRAAGLRIDQSTGARRFLPWNRTTGTRWARCHRT